MKPPASRLTIYFADREPAGPYRLTVPAAPHEAFSLQRTGRSRADPAGTEYASVFVSDVPVVIQHTRLDSRQAENALDDHHGLSGRGMNRLMNTPHHPRVIVITGARAGVGRAVAELFAESEGASIGLIARDAAGLEQARQDIEKRGGRALALPCDVADAAAVDAAAERVERELGPIDVWVNCAMTSVFAFIKDTTPEEFQRVTEVCYLGYVHGTLAALKRMRPRNRGHIVQVGSALAYRGIPLQAAYCASKHAIQGFMDSLRAELIHEGSGIVATMVQMPALNTPQFDWCRSKMPRRSQPVPPIYQPEVAARAVVYASKHRRRELYVGLPTVIAIIGNKILPGLGDRYLARNGVESQQTDEPTPDHAPDNLHQPVPGNQGAHGRFDVRAQGHSLQLWTDLHRDWLAGGLLALVLATLAGWIFERRRR